LLRLTVTGNLCTVPCAQSGSQSDAHATPVPVADVRPHRAQTSFSAPALPSCARAKLCGRTCFAAAKPIGKRYTAGAALDDGLAELLVDTFDVEEAPEEEREELAVTVLAAGADVASEVATADCDDTSMADETGEDTDKVSPLPLPLIRSTISPTESPTTTPTTMAPASHGAVAVTSARR
jgi:hypothetical protein